MDPLYAFVWRLAHFFGSIQLYIPSIQSLPADLHDAEH